MHDFVLTGDFSYFLFFLSIFTGFTLGILSGLTPGIHTNNFALLLAAGASMMEGYGFYPFYIAVMILSNSVSHSFHDIIPSVFLGAPDSSTALAVLPGHKLLLEGNGPEAVRLSALGSAGAVVFSMFLLFPLIILFDNMYPFIQEYMGWLLIFIACLMISSENGEYIPAQGSLVNFKFKLYALMLFLLSGLLGYLSFQLEHFIDPAIDIFNSSILLPLLSGLFGSSQLIVSMLSGSSIPSQINKGISLSRKRVLRGIVAGSSAGSFVAWIPGISSSVAAIVARLCIKENFERYGEFDETETESSKEFLVSVSGVNTSNSIFGLFALIIIERARSGAMVAFDELLDISMLGKFSVALFVGVILFASILSYISTIVIGDNIHSLLSKLNYLRLCQGVLIALLMIVFLSTGTFGLVIFLISTSVGMLAPFMNIRRSHSMGVIMVPVIIYFI